MRLPLGFHIIRVTYTAEESTLTKNRETSAQSPAMSNMLMASPEPRPSATALPLSTTARNWPELSNDIDLGKVEKGWGVLNDNDNN